MVDFSLNEKTLCRVEHFSFFLRFLIARFMTWIFFPPTRWGNRVVPLILRQFSQLWTVDWTLCLFLFNVLKVFFFSNFLLFLRENWFTADITRSLKLTGFIYIETGRGNGSPRRVSGCRARLTSSRNFVKFLYSNWLPSTLIQNVMLHNKCVKIIGVCIQDVHCRFHARVKLSATVDKCVLHAVSTCRGLQIGRFLDFSP